jgi:hypothetical protein
MLDSQGNPILYKSSRAGKYQKGDPRMTTVFKQNPLIADKHDVEMQLNMYRIMFNKLLEKKIIKLEDVIGKPVVKHLRVFAIVRDGNTYIARQRGLFEPTYMIPIDIKDDEEVLNYHREKSNYLIQEMDKALFANPRDVLKNPPRMGTRKETYDGWICKNSCPVSYLCKRCYEHPVEAEGNSPLDNLIDINTATLKV